MNNTDNLAALMKLSLNGDQRAYADLLRETSRLLRPFLAKRLSFTNEVDDLLQEILISLHKARHTYDGNRPFKPWIYAIATFRLQIICEPIIRISCTMPSNYPRWKKFCLKM